MTQSVPTSVTPLGAEPFELPEPPSLPGCPVCKTGLLYVIAHDPEALHERQPRTREGDPTDHAHYVASGGSLRLKCFNCETTQTQPINPEPSALERALAAAAIQQAAEAQSARPA